MFIHTDTNICKLISFGFLLAFISFFSINNNNNNINLLNDLLLNCWTYNCIGSIDLVILYSKRLYVKHTGHEMHDKIATITVATQEWTDYYSCFKHWQMLQQLIPHSHGHTHICVWPYWFRQYQLEQHPAKNRI